MISFCMSPPSLVFTRKQIHRWAGEITCEGRRQQYLIPPHRLPNSSTQQRYRSRACGLVDKAVINYLVIRSPAIAPISRLHIDDRTFDGILHHSITAPGVRTRDGIRHISEHARARDAAVSMDAKVRHITVADSRRSFLPQLAATGAKFSQASTFAHCICRSTIHTPCTSASLLPIPLRVSTIVTSMSAACWHCA